MRKPNALREFLTQALPELARDPEALSIYVTGGQLVTRYGENLGFEMRYTLHCVLLNFRSDPEQLFLPITLWLRQHQPDLIQNHERGTSDIAFAVDVVDNAAVDVEITLPLSEAVDVVKDGNGYKMTVREESMPEQLLPLTDPLALLKQIWAPAGPYSQLLAGYPDLPSEPSE